MRIFEVWMMKTNFLTLFTFVNCVGNPLMKVEAKDYNDNEKVMVYVNKVGPYANPHETYHYYELPVCRPSQIVHKSLSLGEVLDGDRMAESLYAINFKQVKMKSPICPPMTLTQGDIEKLKIAIEENYYFEFVIDEIPLHNFVGRLDEEGLFPHAHKIFLYTHHHFVLEYNGHNIISAKVDVQREPPIRLDEMTQSNLEISYTYSVEWKETSTVYKDRSRLLEDVSFFPKSLEIHWLSVINSTLLVFLLMGFVVLILIRVVRSDLMRYNQGPDEEKETDLDNGWKVIHTDVFRYPKHKNLFSAVLGVGFQLLTIVVTILIFGSLNLLNVHRHGLINAICVILYALTSGLAGYISASTYKKFGGSNWVWNINLTSALFSLPAFLVWCVENSVSWAYHSTQALPYTTVVLLFAIWVLIGYPLTVVGGILGKNFGGKYEAPCRTRNIPRELPDLPWYHSDLPFGVIGGFLPFSAISVELYYIFATIWGHERYTLFGILLIVFLILLSVTACVSVALTYFQLAAEDYRWWWRSIVVGGSTGCFVLLYSVFYFYKRSEMSGFLQTAQYFGYASLICYAFFLSLGTVSFFASQKFVKYIYSSVKTD